MPKERVPNQKYIQDTRKTVCDKEHIYAAINMNALHTAMLRLKGEHFKVWIYFAKNATGYQFYLSSKDVCEKCGISRNTYDRAIAELIENHYLVPSDEENSYIFFDFPNDFA